MRVPQRPSLSCSFSSIQFWWPSCCWGLWECWCCSICKIIDTRAPTTPTSPRPPTIPILAAKLPSLPQALPRPLPLLQLPHRFRPQPQHQPLAQAPETRTSPRSWRSPGLNESQGLQGPRPTPLSPLSSCLPLSCQGHLALLSRLCSPGGFPSCQVWCAELQMGPKGVAEPHCLNQCPAHPSTHPAPSSRLFACPTGESPWS